MKWTDYREGVSDLFSLNVLNFHPALFCSACSSSYAHASNFHASIAGELSETFVWLSQYKPRGSYEPITCLEFLFRLIIVYVCKVKINSTVWKQWYIILWLLVLEMNRYWAKKYCEKYKLEFFLVLLHSLCLLDYFFKACNR